MIKNKKNLYSALFISSSILGATILCTPKTSNASINKGPQPPKPPNIPIPKRILGKRGPLPRASIGKILDSYSFVLDSQFAEDLLNEPTIPILTARNVTEYFINSNNDQINEFLKANPSAVISKEKPATKKPKSHKNNDRRGPLPKVTIPATLESSLFLLDSDFAEDLLNDPYIPLLTSHNVTEFFRDVRENQKGTQGPAKTNKNPMRDAGLKNDGTPLTLLDILLEDTNNSDSSNKQPSTSKDNSSNIIDLTFGPDILRDLLLDDVKNTSPNNKQTSSGSTSNQNDVVEVIDLTSDNPNNKNSLNIIDLTSDSNNDIIDLTSDSENLVNKNYLKKDVDLNNILEDALNLEEDFLPSTSSGNSSNKIPLKNKDDIYKDILLETKDLEPVTYTKKDVDLNNILEDALNLEEDFLPSTSSSNSSNKIPLKNKDDIYKDILLETKDLEPPTSPDKINTSNNNADIYQDLFNQLEELDIDLTNPLQLSDNTKGLKSRKRKLITFIDSPQSSSDESESGKKLKLDQDLESE